MLILRRLRKTPGFTLVCILTLALGIGGTTAAFSVVNAVLLRPLDYRDPERLVGMWHRAPGLGMEQIEQSDGTYTTYLKATRSFESIGAYRWNSANLTGGDAPQYVRVVDVTATMLPTLGVAPSLGRGIRAEDDRPGASPVAIISHALWKSRFGGDPSVIGRTLQLDGVAHEVIGVMPESFRFPDADAQLWRAMQIDPAHVLLANFNMDAIGRLRPGVSIAAAEAEMQPLLLRLPDELGGPFTKEMVVNAKLQGFLRPLRDDVVGDIKPVLFTVLGTVAFVLLIACANVANLFLVRAEARQKEVAVRTAIGASPSHVVRLFLGESFVLTAGGAAVGIGLAWAALRLLIQLAPSGLPRMEEISLDASALFVALAIALVAGLGFGALPLMRGTSRDLVPTLKDGGRGATAGRERQRVRNAFVVAQVALALVLLAGSGLMARSFQRLRDVNPGFQAKGVLTIRVALPGKEYAAPLRTAAFEQQLVDRIAALPGVQSAGLSSKLPLLNNGHNGNGVWVEDHPLPPGGVPSVHSTAMASDGYFKAMGIPLVEGRTFSREATTRHTGEVIVGRAFAKHFWPNGSALGKRVKTDGPEAPWGTIVGVVGDVHDEALTKPVDGMVYHPLIGAQQVIRPGQDSLYAPNYIALVVRTAGEPTQLTAAVRREIWALDPKLPLVRVRTMTEVVSGAMARTTFTLLMLGIAAGVALLLGAIGIYGVISYMVSLRTRELGVRMALGAQSRDVGTMVVRQGLILAGSGVAIGLVGALAVGRLVSSLLYGVAPNDPATLGSVAVALLAVAALASWLPARRASRIDPVEALRAD